MTCTPISLPGGVSAIVCTKGRGRRLKCRCGHPADLLCDAPGKGEGGTCSEPLCYGCRKQRPNPKPGGPPLDYCPRCFAPPAPPAPPPARGPPPYIHTVLHQLLPWNRVVPVGPCEDCGGLVKRNGPPYNHHGHRGPIPSERAAYFDTYGAPWPRCPEHEGPYTADCLGRVCPLTCCPTRPIPELPPLRPTPALPTWQQASPDGAMSTPAPAPVAPAASLPSSTRCRRAGCGHPLELHGAGGCRGTRARPDGPALLCTCTRRAS